MTTRLATGIAVLLLTVSSAPAVGQDLQSALEPFTGQWEGPFTVYRYDGTRVDSLIAEHDYRWEGDVQVGDFKDRYPATGRVLESTARNYVEDGQLVCEVTSEDGTTTVHTGAVVDGAIVWSRKTDDGIVESFRERVVETPDGREYRIDGFGIYPNDTGPPSYLLFVGRYQDVSNGRE